MKRKRPWLSVRDETARVIAQGLERLRPAAAPTPTPVDARGVVAKALVSNAAEIGDRVAEGVARLYAPRLAALERRLARAAEAQQATAAEGLGYLDPVSRTYVPLPPADEPADRELAKAERLAVAATALPDGPLKSEAGKAGAYQALVAAPPWRRSNGHGP